MIRYLPKMLLERSPLRLIVCLVFVIISSTSKSQAFDETKYSFKVSAASIAGAMLQVATQSNIQLIMGASSSSHVADIKFNGVTTLASVLDKILADTGLEYEFLPPNMVIVKEAKRTEDQEVISQKMPITISDTQPALEEIVISAQKRDQDPVRAPMSVQVLSNDRLNTANISRIEDINTTALSLTFSQKRGFDQSSLRIRGIGTQVLAPGVEPSVSTLVDGVVMATGGSQLGALLDVERIEIMNGPQGIIHGKNASAGLISIITKPTNSENFEYKASTQITNDRDASVNFGITGPISERLSYRVSGLSRQWDGNAFNTFTNDKVNGVRTNALLAKLQADISTQTRLILSADFSQQDTECCARITRVDRLGISVDPQFIGSSASGGSIEQVLGFPISTTGNRIAQNQNPQQNSTNWGLSLHADREMNEFTLTSISAIRGWESENNWDNDLLPLPLHKQQISDRDTNWFTQEIRLTSPADRELEYILGLYYYNSTTKALELANRTYVNIPIEQHIFVDSVSKSINFAIFGNADWRLSESIVLFGGARLLNDTDAASVFRGGQNSTLDDEILFDFSTARVENRHDDTVLIGRAGAQFYFNKDVHLFGAASTGYKSGSFTLEFGFDPDRFLNDEPTLGEDSRSLEIGIKGHFFDRKLRSSLIAYETIFDNLQLGQRDLNSISNIIGSVPETKSRGVEFSFDGLIDENWELYGGVAYNSAFFSDFNNGLCYLGQTLEQGCIGGAQDLTGKPLENAPKWKVLFNSNFQKDLGKRGMRAFINAAYRWQSEAYLTDVYDPESVQDSFSVVDFSVGITTSEQRWRTTLFVKNLFNQKYVSGVSANGADGGGVLVHTIPRDSERYIGLTVEYQGGIH